MGRFLNLSPTPKIIGDFGKEIHSHLSYSITQQYIKNKHNLDMRKLDKVNLVTLHHYISSIPIHSRASTVKLIHGWATFAKLCQQGCKTSPICPQCLSTVETQDHVLTCPNHDAQPHRRASLLSFLTSLRKSHTPRHILTILEYNKISLLLH